MVRYVCSSTQLLPCKIWQRKHDKAESHSSLSTSPAPAPSTISCHPLGHRSHSCKGLHLLFCSNTSTLHLSKHLEVGASPTPSLRHAAVFTKTRYPLHLGFLHPHHGGPPTRLDSGSQKPFSVSWQERYPEPVPSQTSPKRSVNHLLLNPILLQITAPNPSDPVVTFPTALQQHYQPKAE